MCNPPCALFQFGAILKPLSVLVAYGEALLVVSRLLQLVDHGCSIVLHRDVARASGFVDDEVVLAQAVLARALALGIKLTGRGEEHPVDVVFLGELVEVEVAQRAHAVNDFGRDGTRIDHAQARLHK